MSKWLSVCGCDIKLKRGVGQASKRLPLSTTAGLVDGSGAEKKWVCRSWPPHALGLPVTGDVPGPPGDIPGRAGTFPKKVGDIPASIMSPTPRRGYPRPPGTSRAASGISPAARGYRLGDIPGRVGDIPDERGHPRPLAGGIPDRLGDIPGPLGGVPPASWSLVPHTQPTCVCHITRSKPTRQHVKRCLCDTARPSEGCCCAAVAATRAALVPAGEARTSEPHGEARRGVRRAESP